MKNKKKETGGATNKAWPGDKEQNGARDLELDAALNPERTSNNACPPYQAACSACI
jgi:hypothetical protein